MYNFFFLINFFKKYKLTFFLRKKKNLINLLKSPMNNKKHKNQIGLVKHYMYIYIHFFKKSTKMYLNFFYFYKMYTYIK